MEQFRVVVEDPALFDGFSNSAGKDVEQLATNHRVEQRLHLPVPCRVAVPKEAALFLRVNLEGMRTNISLMLSMKMRAVSSPRELRRM